MILALPSLSKGRKNVDDETWERIKKLLTRRRSILVELDATEERGWSASE